MSLYWELRPLSPLKDEMVEPWTLLEGVGLFSRYFCRFINATEE
jgi:hypothetical protein